MASFVRGADIDFTVTFADSSGTSANPTSATLRVSYPLNGVDTIETIALAQAGSTWSGTWDSAVSDEGTVHWHIRSVGAPQAAKDGFFKLTANEANTDPA